MNGRFQIAIHILSLLQKAEGQSLSSDFIAGSVNVNPVLIRKEIRNLKASGFVGSKEGKNGGYILSKSASEINLADIYTIVNENSLLGKAKNEPNPACLVGKNVHQHLSNLSADLDQKVLNELKDITLEIFIKQFN